MFSIDSFFLALKERLPHFGPAQRKIAEFIIRNPRVIDGLTIRELAEKTGTTPAAVVTFYKSLSYNGFRAMKSALSEEIDLVESMSFYLVRPSNHHTDLISAIHNNVRFASASMSQESIRQACDLILKSKAIDILAFGFDAVAGQDAFLKLKQLGFQCNFFQNACLQKLSASHLNTEGCALAISSSFSSRDILDSIQFARRRGAKTIAFAPQESQVLEAADVRLPLQSKSEILAEGGILSRYVQLFAIDSLFLKLLESDPLRFAQTFEQFDRIIHHK